MATNFTVTDIELPYHDTLTVTAPISATGYIGRQVLTTSIGVIDAWCIDLFHDDAVGGGQNLPFTTSTLLTDGSGHTLSSATIGLIAGLITYGDAVLDGKMTGTTTNLNDFSASVQLAIWTVEYPTFTYDNGGNTVLGGLVSADMTAASGYGGNATALNSINGGQGLVTAVPEPTSAALLGAGLLGLVGFGRVRRQRG
jgi:hypothetical protein